MAEKKPVVEMAAELLREAGLLIVVFVPVDVSIQRVDSGRLPWLGALFALGACFIVFGILAERRRK